MTFADFMRGTGRALRLLHHLSFSDYAILSGGVILLSAFLESRSHSLVHFALSIGTLAFLFIYVLIAQDDERPINATAASEVIVALGIASVVAGLVFSLWDFLSPKTGSAQISFESLKSILFPFMLGLASAAIAPVLAVILRYRESAMVISVEDAIDTSAVAADLKNLEGRLKAVLAEADAFAVSLRTTAADIRDAGKDAIGSLRGLGSSVKSEASMAGEAFRNLTMATNDLENGLAAMKEKIEPTTAATEAFKTRMEEGTELLNGLAQLISSVKRFIDRRRMAA